MDANSLNQSGHGISDSKSQAASGASSKSDSRIGLILLAILLAEALLASPVLFTLLGRKHMWSFLMGLSIGSVNLLLLAMICRGFLTTARDWVRNALIFAIILKYLLVAGLLILGLNEWKLPPVTLVAGIFGVFPGVFWTAWYSDKTE